MKTAFFLILFGWNGNSSGGVTIPNPYPDLAACQAAAKGAARADKEDGSPLVKIVWTFCVPAPQESQK